MADLERRIAKLPDLYKTGLRYWVHNYHQYNQEGNRMMMAQCLAEVVTKVDQYESYHRTSFDVV